jgi:hypothetical protein
MEKNQNISLLTDVHDLAGKNTPTDEGPIPTLKCIHDFCLRYVYINFLSSTYCVGIQIFFFFFFFVADA